MSSRREEILDAAVAVLGRGGVRAFTHRAVDAVADLPEGTTSNHFRTRAALIDGVLAHVNTKERARCDELMGAIDQVITMDELVNLAAGVVAQVVGPGREDSLARFALTLEAAHTPELRPALRQWTEQWAELTTQLLANAGVPDPKAAADWVLPFLDGLILDLLSLPDREVDIPATVRAALAPLLPAGGGS